MKLRVCLICFFVVALLPLVADAQNWPRFRGMNGSGRVIMETVPAEITEANYEWKIELPGDGHSSPVIWGDRLFVFSGAPDSGSRHLTCHDVKTGDELWRKDFESKTHQMHARSSYASSTPAVDELAVYATWAEPGKTLLLAFDHDGNELWKQDLGHSESQHGFGNSPIVVDEKVIFFHSQQGESLRDDQIAGVSKMLAFDRRTGNPIWETPLKTTRVCYSVPCVFAHPDGNRELIGTNTGDGMFALDLQNGKMNWSIDLFTMRTVASVYVADGIVYGSCGSGGGGNYLVAVQPLAEEPRELFRVNVSANYVPTPIVCQGLLFMWGDKGIVSCVDAKSGKRHWRERCATAFSGSPICVEDRLYGISEEGELIVLKASEEFEEICRHDLGEMSYSTPAVSNGRLFLKTKSHLIAVGDKKG